VSRSGRGGTGEGVKVRGGGENEGKRSRGRVKGRGGEGRERDAEQGGGGGERGGGEWRVGGMGRREWEGGVRLFVFTLLRGEKKVLKILKGKETAAERAGNK